MKKKKRRFNQFFRPDLGKVFVVYVLFLLTLVLSISWITPPPKTMRMIELSLFRILIPTRFYFEGVSLMVSWVFYWYLVSCAIVWVHRELSGGK